MRRSWGGSERSFLRRFVLIGWTADTLLVVSRKIVSIHQEKKLLGYYLDDG